MISISLRYEDRERERHEVNINNKVFTLVIDRSPDGPVFSFRDEGVVLEPAEQSALLVEMEALGRDFSSRRLWGTFVPKTYFPQGLSKKSFKRV